MKYGLKNIIKNAKVLRAFAEKVRAKVVEQLEEEMETLRQQTAPSIPTPPPLKKEPVMLETQYKNVPIMDADYVVFTNWKWQFTPRGQLYGPCACRFDTDDQTKCSNIYGKTFNCRATGIKEVTE